MRCRRLRRNSSSRFAGVCEAVTIEEAVRAAKAINRRVRCERIVASSAAREMYIRLKMGLPATPSMRDRAAAQ